MRMGSRSPFLVILFPWLSQQSLTDGFYQQTGLQSELDQSSGAPAPLDSGSNQWGFHISNPDRKATNLPSQHSSCLLELQYSLIKFYLYIKGPWNSPLTRYVLYLYSYKIGCNNLIIYSRVPSDVNAGFEIQVCIQFFFFLIDGFLLLSSLASERPSLSLYSSNLQL